MKKFVKIIAAVMAAATIAVTTSVCTSAIKLKTGEELTIEVIEQYADLMKALELSCDSMIIFSEDMGFWSVHMADILAARDKNEHEFAYIDEWATHQKAKVRQTEGGCYKDFWDQYSAGGATRISGISTAQVEATADLYASSK